MSLSTTDEPIQPTPSSGGSQNQGQPGPPRRGGSVEVLPQSSVLCLDGGGIKGYSTLLILRVLMEEIYRILYPGQEPPAAGVSVNGHAVISEHPMPLPRDFFEYIIGTSSGGLIALMLGRLKMNVDECLEAYQTLGDSIFGHPRWRHIRQFKIPFLWWPRSKYNKQKFEDVIQRFVNTYEPRRVGDPAGSDYLPDPEDHCKTGVVAVIEDDDGARPYLFRSYHHFPHTCKSTVLNPGRATNILIAKVARATAAAPPYFQHANLRGEKFVDGGLGNNNPSWIAYFEVKQMHEFHHQNWRAAHQVVGQTPATDPEHQPNAVGILVSLGTGKAKRAKLIGPAGVSRYLGYMRLTRHMATNSEEVHQRMVNATSIYDDTHYHRFNVQTGLEDVKLDEWKTSKDAERRTVNVTLRKIETMTRAYLESPGVREEIRKCAWRLVHLGDAAGRVS